MQWVLHLIFRSPHFRAEIPHFYQTKYSAINRNLKSTDWRSSVSIGCLFIFFGIFNFHLFISPFFLFFFPRRTTQFLFGFFYIALFTSLISGIVLSWVCEIIKKRETKAKEIKRAVWPSVPSSFISIIIGKGVNKCVCVCVSGVCAIAEFESNL